MFTYSKLETFPANDYRLDGRCWKYPGPVYSSNDSSYYLTHYYLWIERHGPLPQGMKLNRLCGRDNCANPKHYRLIEGKEVYRLSRYDIIAFEERAIDDIIRIMLTPGYETSW